MSRTSTWARYVLLALTIIGGLHGIALVATFFFSPEPQSLFTFVLVLCMMAAYGYMTAAACLFLALPEPGAAILLGASDSNPLDLYPWIRLQIGGWFVLVGGLHL